MTTNPDLGYDPSSLSWTYKSEARLLRTSNFQEQHALVGDRFILLLNAAKRLTAHQAGATRGHKVAALRRIALAISKYSSAQASFQEWLDAFSAYLRTDETTGATSRWSHFNHGSAIIAEAARYERTAINVRNPFKRRKVHAQGLANDADVERLIRQAKQDAIAYVTRFRTPGQEHVYYIAEARRLWRANGALVANRSDEVQNLFREWQERTDLDFSYLTSYLYPSAIDLAPFLLLVGNALAGNPDSVSLMRRDSLQAFVHPVYGACYKLQLEKPRAGSIAPYLIRNKATLSLGWLIEAVMELTTPLVPLATEDNRNYIFLAMTNPPLIKPVSGPLRGETIRRYLAKRNLPHMTLKALRTYRGVSEYNKSGDIFRVKKLLNQSTVGITIDYLDEHLTRDINASIIADVQTSILEPVAKTLSPKPTDERSILDAPIIAGGSHKCKDPLDASKEHDKNGFCASYLWPFNDRCFILDFSPRPVAFMLRDYDALCEAQLRIPSVRFERYYAARKQRIETDVLPHINNELRRQAEALLSSIPAGPVID